jgi:hypothetical protein
VRIPVGLLPVELGRLVMYGIMSSPAIEEVNSNYSSIFNKYD